MGFLWFGKKARTPSVAPAVPATVHESTVIYTMPEKFMLPDTPPFWTTRRVWAVVVALVLLLVGVAYWLLASLPPPAVTPSSTPPPAVPPAAATLPPEPATPPPAAPEPTPVPVAPATPPPEAPSAPEPEPSLPAAPLPTAADRDQDGLTDLEEALYGSSPDLVDTDVDGYLDRDEVVNGYNPAGAGTLAAAGKLVTYRDQQGRFTAAHPAAWVVEAPAQGGSAADAQFVIAAGEFVSVLLEPNPEGRSVVDWYVARAGLANSPLLEPVGEHNGLFSADRLTFYFVPAVRPTSVFVVTYHIGATPERSYPTAFEAFLRSLQPAPAVP
jgi:hypothetical protein